jgi:hypothetical protein
MFSSNERLKEYKKALIGYSFFLKSSMLMDGGSQAKMRYEMWNSKLKGMEEALGLTSDEIWKIKKELNIIG